MYQGEYESSEVMHLHSRQIRNFKGWDCGYAIISSSNPNEDMRIKWDLFRTYWRPFWRVKVEQK